MEDKISKIKQALFDRLDSALKNIYHNATPEHPYSLIPDELFQEYLDTFDFECEEAIHDLNHPFMKSWKKQIKLGFTKGEREYWLLSRITEFGKLYTYGRGGRTLCPQDLNVARISNFKAKTSEDFADKSNEYLTDTIQVIETFNDFVERWNSEKNLAALAHDMFHNRLCDVRYEIKDIRKKCIEQLRQVKKCFDPLHLQTAAEYRLEHKEQVKKIGLYQKALNNLKSKESK